VEVCANPLQAPERLQQVRFDALASDYRMPRLDCCSAEVFRYIAKPWREPQLLADLRAALELDPSAVGADL